MKSNLVKEPLKVAKFLILLYLALVVVIFFWLFLGIYSENAFYDKSTCFSYSCLKSFGLSFKSAIGFLELSLKLLLTSVTIFSIYYALKNYISATKAAKTTIHLTNLNTFKDYLMAETKYENIFNIKRVDVLKWYNIIYPESRLGELYVSNDYKEKIKKINNLIDKSNGCFSGESEEKTLFDYKKHQTDMINALKTIGITLSRSPRNNFRDAEKSVFDLINKINKEFCGSNNVGLIKPQLYR
ncbi:retron Ec48 family effector membrane protein [Pseudoalteromonas sp. Of11M-6]|uniref:retron Ec48 family effector membrane protein n=1 Tax=Pseudoalteromonas sp. Of11M-6 TaxID=2917754 RepID=UPI001EF6DF6B|nr:retron Ec48 family effector membrane protein [Pseudoalteromonas sp. Of11M-6]MCG7552758.1 retron Ec48 family effector membrane protein [Pseudoalteromonas sp. Of11M-6]